MSEQIRNGKPRKILGSNGSSSGSQLNASNATLNINYQQQQNSACSYTLNESSIYSNLTFSNNSLNPIPLQAPQQMDRFRFPLMNQEMHALWPYGTTTILSPMIPANLALPYALPYTAVPIYPSGTQQQCSTSSPVSNVSSASSSSTASQQNQMQPQQPSMRSAAVTTASATGDNCPPTNLNSSNDSNKINIQIQCVSQNAPMNFNTMNDSLAKVNFGNFCNSSCPMGEKDNKEATSSLRNSPIPLTSDDSAAGGDASNFNYNGANGYNMTSNGTPATGFLSQARFNELTRLALRGSDIAENLAKTHRNRPCFKKIDSLCARLKQDLIRPDGVLPNINSQGIAWAVKDFIFVFTRIINAWIIIKGYVYNTPEGLNKVKAALSPEFAVSFAAWQDTTMVFIESLIKSFVNLDNLVQSQKNVYQKTDTTSMRNNNSPIKLLPTVNDLLEDSFDFLNGTCEKSSQLPMNKNYIYTMVEDSESQQRQATVNGTYFKTGTYNPIKKDTLLNEQAPIVTATTNVNIISTESASHHMLTAPVVQYINDPISAYWTSPPEIDTTVAITSTDQLKPKEKMSNNLLNYDLSLNLPESSDNYNPIDIVKSLGKDLTEKLNAMVEGLMSMKNADMFFKIQFTNNYFPDFINKHKHDLMDIRSIILKSQVGGYQSIFEMVHDVKKIIHFGKEFLKTKNDEKLQNAINIFETEFNKLLIDPPFENIQFGHITGEPKEHLCNCRNK